MTAFESFDALAKHVDEATEGRGLNLLIHNAAIGDRSEECRRGLGGITAQHMLLHFETNTLGPLLLSQVRRPQSPATILVISVLKLYSFVRGMFV